MNVILRFLITVRQATAYFLSFLAFPLNCISCSDISYGLPLCKTCKQDLCDYIIPIERRCSACGEILISENDTCLPCREALNTAQNIFHRIDFIFPIYPYVLWKKELLFVWKMANNRAFSPFFAEIVFQILQKYFPGMPVVPVPPRPGKIKKKGWDQMQELCFYLKILYDVPTENLLIRRSTGEQKKRNRTERFDCIGQTYALAKLPAQKKLPQSAVILDDILTTGATLAACADVLKKAGVEHIYAVTLFKV
ncbi:MAG: phosphoribosyltransferase family protein [Spirochaetales bacterium]